MLKIRVCATSANLSVGFDVLGLALDLKNEFSFKPANEFSFIGFEDQYCNEKNLVYLGYCATFKKANKKPVPVQMGFSGNIPISRGLGSSSSLLVAGVFAANEYLNHHFNKEELFNICVELEGHPDNVAAAIYGGLVASYFDGKKYHGITYEVSPQLKFNVIVPPYEVSTVAARSVLPRKIEYDNIVYNLSRIIHIPLAFKTGDMKLLKVLFDDKLHEPYRENLVPDFRYYKDNLKDCAVALSGSGSSIFVIGNMNPSILKKGHILYQLPIGSEIEIRKEEENERGLFNHS